MFLQVNGFSIESLQKAKDKIVVEIIANHLTEDLDNERILKEAFNKEDVKEFLDIGVIEYWHETRNPILNKEDKNKYLLGKPIGFRWKNGKPVVKAELTATHPIVQQMLPHLEAEQPVYAASVGGKKMVLEVEDEDGINHKIIPKIKWDHLAIAPCNSVVNREPGMNVRLLQKANDVICEFDNCNIFSKNIDIMGKEEDLKKALIAPERVTDLYSTPEGVITKQSIEKTPVDLIFSENDGLDLIDTIIGIKEKRIPLNKKQYLKHFKNNKKEDFGYKSYNLIDKYFKRSR